MSPEKNHSLLMPRKGACFLGIRLILFANQQLQAALSGPRPHQTAGLNRGPSKQPQDGLSFPEEKIPDAGL